MSIATAETFFQAGVFCGLGDCRGYISNCDQMIDF